MQNRHLIDLSDLSVAEWEEITALASDIRRHMDDYYGVCRGKILATLFYEPSTRTQMSFQTAMLRLGGRIIGFDNPPPARRWPLPCIPGCRLSMRETAGISIPRKPSPT